MDLLRQIQLICVWQSHILNQCGSLPLHILWQRVLMLGYKLIPSSAHSCYFEHTSCCLHVMTLTFHKNRVSYVSHYFPGSLDEYVSNYCLIIHQHI